MENICELIEEFCDERAGCSYYPDYSGRFMYGKTCAGIVIDDSVYGVLVELCDFLHESGISCVSDALGTICTDSMGRSQIIYMPKLAGKK